MKTERERRTSRAVMLVIESVRDLTRLLIWPQYLNTTNTSCRWTFLPYLVTLNTLRRRTQRRTERPSVGANSNSVKITLAIKWIINTLGYCQNTSIRLVTTTNRSNRLNRLWRYSPRPRAKIFSNNSKVKRITKTMLATFCKRTKSGSKSEMVNNNLEGCEPHWLAIVLGGKDTAVEEDKKKDEPIHSLRLDCPQAPFLCPRVCFQEPFSSSNF